MALSYEQLMSAAEKKERSMAEKKSGRMAAPDMAEKKQKLFQAAEKKEAELRIGGNAGPYGAGQEKPGAGRPVLQPKSTFSPTAALVSGISPAAGRALLGYTRPMTLTEKPSTAVDTEKKAVSQATPYAMGRDAFTPASPYAAGLQAKEASETPEVTQPDTTLPTFPQRVMDTISGGLKGTGASMTNMIGTLREMGQKSRDKENQAVIDNYARELEEAQVRLDAALEDVAKDPKAWTQGDIQGFYNMRDDAQRKYDAVAKVYGKENQEKTIQGAYEAADKLQLSSARDIEEAKEGLGVPGQMLVDAGASVAQMAGDAVGGALLGNGMIPFVMRAFGGGTQQARQDGADLKGQVGYGAAIAAKEYVTEKMFGIALPFSRVYGGGAVDDAVERVIQKAVEKLASTPQGQKAVGGLLTMLASGVTEGLEEFIGDWLEWQMPRIYGGNVDTAAETLQSSLYDFAVGGITGLAGGAFSLGQYTPQGMEGESVRPAGMDENTWAALQRTAGEMYRDGKPDTPGGVETGVQAQKTAPVQGTESTYVDTDPATHTLEQMQKIREYQKATDNGILAFIKKWAGLKDPNYRKKVRIPIAEVTARAVADIKAIVGIDTSGYQHALSGGALEHIARRHGVQGKADHSMADPNDIARMSYVLENYDSVSPVLNPDGTQKMSTEYQNSDNTPAPLIQFSKRIDGTYYVVEAVPDSAARQLRVVSAYLSKDNGSTDQMLNMPHSGPQLTPKAPNGADTSTDPIIPSVGDGVKGEYTPGSGEDTLTQTAREMATKEWQGKRQREEKAIHEAASTFGKYGAQMLEKFYQNSDQPSEKYYGSFAAYYHAGLTGQSMDTVRREFTGQLHPTQANAAYTAGQLDAAESLKAEAKAAGFASVAGKDAGLVGDEYVASHLNSKSYQQLNSVLKLLGLRGRFVDGSQVLNGKANAQIKGSEVLIAKDHQHPIRFVVGHEITHRLQQLAPQQYRAFRDFVAQDEIVRNDIFYKLRSYGEKGVELNYEGALDEAVADYAGELFEDGKLMDEFIQRHRTDKNLLEKLKDGFHYLVSKLTGREKAQAQTAEGKLTAALDAATQQAKTLTEQSGGQNTAVTEDGETARYSRKYDPETASVKEQIANNREKLSGMVAVATVQVPEHFAKKSDAVKWAIELLAKTGYAVERQGYGRIAFSPKDINHAMNYADTDAEMAAIAALPSVLKRGVEIGRHNDHKGRKKSTVTFAAPVVLNGTRGNMAVVVNQNGDHYYAHRIVMPDGSAFVFSIEKENVAQEPSRGVAVSSSLADTTSATSTDSISQPDGESNPNFSLKGGTEYIEEAQRLKAQARKEGWSDARLREELHSAVDRVYQGYIEEYGAIEAGESPAREVQVPRKTGEHEKVSQTVRTILEAGATPETVIPDIQELVAKGEFSYETITDKAAVERAQSTITDKSWGRAYAEWKKAMASGEVSKENTALGWALYNNAANSGNVEVAMDILQEMVRSQRNAAQALQATRILKTLSPESQLYGVVQSVEGLQKELNKRYGEKKAPTLEINKELGERLLEAKDQTERDEILKDIYRDIGRQMPSRFRDKWNAWRYLSMLGNPRTHVRNVVGNAGFAPVVMAKNLTATAIEKAVSAVSGGRLERSKAFVGVGKKSRGLLSAAWADYVQVEEAALGGGKYSDMQNANKYVEEGRVIFQPGAITKHIPGAAAVGKTLEAARKANSRALDVEDVWFSRPHYAYAMAQYCAAHKITEAEIRAGNAAVLSAARNYAIKEAHDTK